MTDDEINKIHDKSQSALRKFFPQDYPDLKYEMEVNEFDNKSPVNLFAQLLGLSERFYRDKANSTQERISAMDLHRKLLRDVIELNIFADDETGNDPSRLA